MAAGFFKAIAYRMLWGKGIPQSITMVSDGEIPPTVSTPDTPPPRDSARVVKNCRPPS